MANCNDQGSSENAADFEARFAQMATGAYSMLSVALGSRLGLFHLMSSLEQPFTPKELADAGSFKERYLTEWLGAVVCAGIVDVIQGADEDRYFLPHHRREILTGSAPIFHEFLPKLCSVHEDIVKCFNKDGPKGLPFGCFPEFHEWRDRHMKAEFSEQTVMTYSSMAPEIREKLDRGVRVLSIGCSSGRVELMYAKMFPKSTFVGIDICTDAIDLATKNSNQNGLKNTHFFMYDVYDLPDEWKGSFDGVMGVDILHDLPRPLDAVKMFRKMLRVGGFLSILDIPANGRIADNIGNDMAAPFYIMSLYHCVPLALSAGGMAAGAMWGRENVLECLKQAGFEEVLEPQGELSHRGGLAFYVAWKRQ